MPTAIEVRVAKRGTVRDGEADEQEDVKAYCDLCDLDVDAVVSVTEDGKGTYACKDCLRARLEATTVAQWLLRDPQKGGLPWGKISG